MYKTVRHGENSLQYTILPQQEEGAATAGAAAAAGGRAADSGGRRRRRLPALLLAALLLAAGAATAAVVLPLGATGRLAQALPAALKSLTQHRSSNVTTPAPPPAAVVAAGESLTEAVNGDNQSATVDYDDTTTEAPTSAPTSTSEPSTTVTEIPTTEATSTVPPPPPTPPSPPLSLPPPLPTIAPPPDAAVIVTPRPCNTSLMEKWLPSLPLDHLLPWKVRMNGMLLISLLVLLPLCGIVVASCLTWYVVRRRSQLRREMIGEMSSDLQNDAKSTLLLPDGSEED